MISLLLCHAIGHGEGWFAGVAERHKALWLSFGILNLSKLLLCFLLLNASPGPRFNLRGIASSTDLQKMAVRFAQPPV